MKTTIFKGFAIFFTLLVATSLMMDVFKTEFGTINFFDRHGFFFLFFIAFFPRLTLIFSSVPFGGFFWWLGLVFCPRFLVATLATVTYFHTNPVLVTISWLVALGGEAAEKYGMTNKRFVFKTYRRPDYRPSYEEKNTIINKDDAIEAEFRRDG